MYEKWRNPEEETQRPNEMAHTQNQKKEYEDERREISVSVSASEGEGNKPHSNSWQ